MVQQDQIQTGFIKQETLRTSFPVSSSAPTWSWPTPEKTSAPSALPLSAVVLPLNVTEGGVKLYLNGTKVHILIVEVSALCQLWEVALCEAQPGRQKHRLCVSSGQTRMMMRRRRMKTGSASEQLYSLLDVLHLHAGCAAAAGAHERVCPQLRDLCTPRLKKHNNNINHYFYFYLFNPVLKTNSLSTVLQFF